MRNRWSFLAWMWLGVSALAAPAFHTQARLILPVATARPGDTVLVGVRLTMAPGWHTYWRNGGDSGAPTEIEWQLPAGVAAGPIQWPVPERYETAGLFTYVYHGNVTLLVPLTLTNALPHGPLELQARVSWFECQELCVNGEAQVRATLVLGADAVASADAALIEAARARLPHTPAPAGLKAEWEGPPQDDTRGLILSWPVGRAPIEADFFPYAHARFDVSAATTRLESDPGRVRLRKEVRRFEGDWSGPIAGLLVQRTATSEPLGASEVALAPEGAEVPASGPARGSAREGAQPAAAADPGAARGSGAPLPGGGVPRSLPAMLLFAFLGGLILNVMPCVLPVIALKVLSFVNQSGTSPARVRLLGVVYGVGVLVSFVLLAAAAIAVQHAGGLASWGMVLQHQPFRVILTTVVTLVALNLFGVFEVTLGGRVMGAAGELTAREGVGGAFFNGVLATVLATPCTAPFLGAALAFAFTQPAWITLLVFLCVGLGLAAPFVLLCWQPAWLTWLPKPGRWMERFKVAMGFPLLATAMWLFWFTAPRFGKSGVLWLGLFLVLLAAGAWVWGEFVQRGRARRGLAIAVSLGLVGAAYAYCLEAQLQWRVPAAREGIAGSLRESPEGIDWQAWTPEAVGAARAQGRPVLVDFTADNCLNCQVNKRTSLEIAATRAKLREIGAVAFLADFTDQDPRIARVLQDFGRAGVPLVLVYPARAEAPPEVLPPVLTPGVVLEALTRAARAPAGS